MRKSRWAVIPLLLAVWTESVSAGPKPQPGAIVSHTSVTCGTKKSGKQTTDLLCQEYVVRSANTDYTIRQPKPQEQELIQINTKIQFTLNKNKMKFKVDGRSYEFVIVAQAAASSADAR
jgi:hypothetical protein